MLDNLRRFHHFLSLFQSDTPFWFTTLLHRLSFDFKTVDCLDLLSSCSSLFKEMSAFVQVSFKREVILSQLLKWYLSFSRWRLQRAFYSPETTSSTFCSGFTCQDFIPLFTCFSLAERLNRPLTLDDLAGISPEYICNTTVHEWRVPSSHR